MMQRHLLFAVVLFLVLAVPFELLGLQLTGSHTVAGTVTDAHGSVMPNASITAFPIVEGGSAGSLHWTQADSTGTFRLVLPRGHYRILARDLANGYPDPFLLSRDPSANFPEILVEDSDVSGVRVVLGKRGGVLEGNLRDSETKQAIPKAKVTIRDARNPEAYVEVFTDSAGHFRYAVPSKPIRVVATAAGHAAASYANGAELTLSEGERRTISLDLAPE